MDKPTRITEWLETLLPLPAVPEFVLRVVDGADAGRSCIATTDGASVGTHPSNDLVLSDAAVSRFHFQIAVDSRGPRLRDQGSTNGTWLDGLDVRDAYVRNGSGIRAGRSLIAFETGERLIGVSLSPRTELGGLVGRSPAMRAAFALIERAAASYSTVLLEGETGTGKERAAAAIHGESRRAAGPFVVVDCGSLPTELLESELFGHERGAFTGATERRVGAFEHAASGTVFLDEIGELPPELQPKLLRVLESRQIRRVGANDHRPVDVRIVAATNRNLRGEVNAGRFRADLYYRIAVLTIALPPLRARLADIELLAPRLLAAVGASGADIARILTPARLARLQQNTWPGNVRELRNYLERCLAFAEVADDLAGGAQETSSFAAPADPSAAFVFRMPQSLHTPFSSARHATILHFEKDFLSRLLVRHQGSITQAAQAAQLNRAHLWRVLRRHGLA